MNHSRVVARVHEPGRPPVQRSIVARTTPFGGLNEAIGRPLEYSRMNACQTWPAVVKEVACTLASGAEWSLLPIHTPTARAAASGSAGGAR